MSRSSQSGNARLIEGPVPTTLVNLAAPMLVGIMALMAFNLVDTFFVGRLGTRELAAMTLTFPVVMMIGTFTIGLGVGALATVSHALGEGNRRAVRRLTTDSLLLAACCVGVLMGLGLLSLDPVFTLVGADAHTLPLVKEYMRVWYPGMLFMVGPMVGNNAIRATGDTVTPSVVMVVAVAVNAVLDPLLIFGWGPFPRLELAGAALATVASRGVSLGISLWVLRFRENMLASPVQKVGATLRSWGRILRIGFPVALSNMTIPLALFVVTRIITSLGDPVVAGFGIATRVESFALTLIFAMSTGLSPFIGQNLGAGKVNRIEQAIRFCERFSLGWGVVLFAVLLLLDERIARLFNGDQRVVRAASLYFSLVPVTYGLKGVHQVVWTSANVLDRPFIGFALEFLHAFVLYVPLAWLGAESFGAAGAFGAAAVANVGGGVAAWVWIRRVLGGGNVVGVEFGAASGEEPARRGCRQP